MKTGLLFGAFDGLHEGHRAMLKEARTHADHLVVALPPDTVICELKGKSARFSWKERAKALWESGLVDDVIRGDEMLGLYSAIDTKHPDVIFVGYDQHELAKDLATYLENDGKAIPIVPLSPFKPERYKSSLMNAV